MSHTKPVESFTDEPKPNTFFFRSPFRSWAFITNSILLLGIVVFAIGVVRKSGGGRFLSLLFFLVFIVIYPYLRAIKRHSKINELYLSGKISKQPVGSPMDEILNIADNSINEGLWNTTILFLLLLLALVVWRF